EMALQLGEVLHYLHTRQPPIVFRDLKPSNTIRTPKGKLCLVDFGIARRFRPGQKRDTQALGSPGYAAPEQYGRAQTTPRSDIYSLGALLHFLLSGNDPAEEVSPGLKPLSLHAEQGAEVISDLVQRMLSPDPELRPAAMDEVVAALETVQQQRTAQPKAHVWQPPVPQDPPSSPAGWQQVQIQVPSPSPLPPSQTPAAQTPASGQRGPGRRKVLIGLGVALASVGVGETFWRMYSSPTNSSASPISSVSYPTTTASSSGQRVSIFGGHSDSVKSVAWSPDSKHIVSASKDKTVQVWVAASAQILFSYSGHTDIVNSVA
ncbi:MAG TPA: protein kinase, partial [Ktedonobacteraceae bacterium]